MNLRCMEKQQRFLSSTRERRRIFSATTQLFSLRATTLRRTFTADVLLTRHPDTMEPLPDGATAPNYEPTYG